MAVQKLKAAACPRDVGSTPLENIALMVIHRAAMNTEGATWPFRFALLDAVVEFERQSREKLEKTDAAPELIDQLITKIDKTVWPAIATLLEGKFDVTAPEALQLIHSVGGCA